MVGFASKQYANARLCLRAAWIAAVGTLLVAGEPSASAQTTQQVSSGARLRDKLGLKK